jgi:hypothetical protein
MDPWTLASLSRLQVLDSPYCYWISVHASISYGAVSTFRRVRAALWPVHFPVYASSKPFRHPDLTPFTEAASGVPGLGNAATLRDF